MDRTTPNHQDSTLMTSLVTFSMLLGVGTGGDYTPAYHAVRESKSAFRKARDSSHFNGFAVTADIESARSILSLTMSDLARCLGVSRQALYNWIAGGPIKHENLAKLIELKTAADIIAAENLSHPALFLKRKLPGGKTLLETIASGGNGEDAARAVVRLAEQEAEQKAILAKLFAQRKPQNLLGHGIPELADKSR
jgi:DNA-binding transcriptional regulator YiaG